MFRASLVSFLSLALLLVVRQSSAAEVTTAAPALKDTAITGADITAWSLMFDQSTYGRVLATTITAATKAVLLHKQSPNDTAVKVTECQILAGTADLCQCASGSHTSNGVTTLFTTNLYLTPATPPAAAVALTANTLIIWQKYCTLLGSVNCGNLASAVTTDPNTNKACFLASNVPVVQLSSSTPVSSSGPAVGGSGATSPNPSSTAGATSPGTPVNSTKAGSSMTTPKIAVMTIVPVALLAVANFVV